MRALMRHGSETYHGSENVRVETVPDPQIIFNDDAILRVTATVVCGSDLYRRKMPAVKDGDILGHEFMGIVEDVRSAMTNVKKGELLDFIENGHLSPADIITHRMSLEDAAKSYQIFNEKKEDCRKVVLTP